MAAQAAWVDTQAYGPCSPQERLWRTAAPVGKGGLGGRNAAGGIGATAETRIPRGGNAGVPGAIGVNR